MATGAAGLGIGLYYQGRKDGDGDGGGGTDIPGSSSHRDHRHHGVLPSNSRSSSKTVPDLNRLGLSDQIPFSPPPTSEDVTRQLNEHVWSYAETGCAAVGRYDGAQLGSNSPCEDAYLHGTLANPFAAGAAGAGGGGGGGGDGEPWMAWAVFDGHCGWQMSDLLTTQLVPFVRRALEDVNVGGELSEDAVQEALRTAFTTLDDALVKSAAATIERADLSFPEKARRLEPAYAGACALLALFDPASRTLRVASTGDCRAVLGRRRRRRTASSPPPSSSPGAGENDGAGSGSGSGSGSTGGGWEATELTVDHTGANPDEVARLRALFPDEPGVVAGGRVWGMQPSRTFGDGMWKWAAGLKRTLRERYNGLSLPSSARYAGYRDGPYLTAEPAVAVARVPADGPSFLILATDGLWDTMTSAEAVDLVGRWLDWQQQPGQQPKHQPHNRPPPDFGPTILGWKRSCRYEEGRATVQDGNAAVHLVRNGLGGADEETVRGALTFRYPNSRDIRDDITVQVVFFNPVDGEGHGR